MHACHAAWLDAKHFPCKVVRTSLVGRVKRQAMSEVEISWVRFIALGLTFKG
jgi:hypothetical protein